AGRLAERRRQRARLTEAERQRDFGHRQRALGQHCLGALDATIHVISVRRHAERLLEGAAEMVRTELREPCEHAKGYLLAQMLLDIGGDDPLLAKPQAAFHLGAACARAALEPHE